MKRECKGISGITSGSDGDTGSEEAENELPDAEKKTGASSDLKLTPASKVADEAEKKE